MNWLDHAAAIWGDRWVAPMAHALGLNPRTVQRWKGAELGRANAAGECPERVRQALHNAALELKQASR